MKKVINILIVLILIQACYGNSKKEVKQNIQEILELSNNKINVENDTILISEKHNPNSIVCDLDGDKLQDSVQIVLNKNNMKYGLKISFGNKNTEYLGMGIEVLGQGFDDLNWVGIFEVAPQNEIYYNNVDDVGNLITEEEVKETDKIKLPNDGIFIHQSESCGGGIIYLKNGKFDWIQQA